MAKGEARYSSQGKAVVRFENKPIAEDDYPLELMEEGLEVRKSEEKGPDAIPYIGCRFGAQGTEAKEGAKPRLVFQNFFLSLKPGSDGVVMPERGGGITEFFRAHGEELDVPVITLVKEDESTEDYLDPEPIIEKLKEWTGSVTTGHVSIERERDRLVNGKKVKANPNNPGRNKISHWLVSEDQEQAAPAQAPKLTAVPKPGLKKASGKK